MARKGRGSGRGLALAVSLWSLVVVLLFSVMPLVYALNSQFLQPQVLDGTGRVPFQAKKKECASYHGIGHRPIGFQWNHANFLWPLSRACVVHALQHRLRHHMRCRKHNKTARAPPTLKKYHLFTIWLLACNPAFPCSSHASGQALEISVVGRSARHSRQAPSGAVWSFVLLHHA